MAEETTQETKKMNYPGNSHKDREGRPEKKVEKIISGEVVQRKKPLGKKIAETFAGDDAQSVGAYVLFEVVIPAAKAMIADAGKEALERLLFGDNKRRISGSSGHTSYNKMYSKPGSYSGGSMRDRDSRPLSQRARASHDFDEIVLSTRGEAEEVVDRLGDLVDNYDVATVSDLYDLVGITGSYTDDKWGWTDLRGTEIRRVRDGFLLNLPRTSPID